MKTLKKNLKYFMEAERRVIPKLRDERKLMVVVRSKEERTSKVYDFEFIKQFVRDDAIEVFIEMAKNQHKHKTHEEPNSVYLHLLDENFHELDMTRWE